ncbi:hypothetical protein GCM10027262_75730 [Nocardia tengchongensis]
MTTYQARKIFAASLVTAALAAMAIAAAPLASAAQGCHSNDGGSTHSGGSHRANSLSDSHGNFHVPGGVVNVLGCTPGSAVRPCEGGSH